MERLWGAKGLPTYPKSALPGSTGRGRGGVKPLPRGKRDFGKKDSWEGVPLNHLSPRGLVGLKEIEEFRDCGQRMPRCGSRFASKVSN